MKIGICNEIFRDWPMERIFDYAASLGYEGVEIAPFRLAESVSDISAERRRSIRRAAELAGVEIIGLHWLLLKPEGLSINHPDSAIRRRTQEYLKALIHFCGDIGGAILTHGSPKQRTVQEGWDRAESWKRARETFESCLETARERKIIYCLEPLTRTNTNFINTVDEALAMVEEIGHPHFRMMVDCRSTASNEPSLVESLERALRSAHLSHVHVNDPSGKGPGFGSLNFSPVLRLLKDQGYQRYVSVEVFDFAPDPQTIASRSIGYLQGILEGLGGK
ncbi:MAG: sugar phosphate isomerase/epimerase family protein [Planctomycetaceae bacterium]